MDMGVRTRSPADLAENKQQHALLEKATESIDRLAVPTNGREYLGELLDWLAHFTREHFGFQQRLLSECAQQREYLLKRMTVHSEFRRRLAKISIDMMLRDPTVYDRLRALCHDMLTDAEENDEHLSEIVRNCTFEPRLRKSNRHEQKLSDQASQLFRS